MLLVYWKSCNDFPLDSEHNPRPYQQWSHPYCPVYAGHLLCPPSSPCWPATFLSHAAFLTFPQTHEAHSSPGPNLHFLILQAGMIFLCYPHGCLLISCRSLLKYHLCQPAQVLTVSSFNLVFLSITDPCPTHNSFLAYCLSLSTRTRHCEPGAFFCIVYWGIHSSRMLSDTASANDGRDNAHSS